MIKISYAESLNSPLKLLEFADLQAMSCWLASQPAVSDKMDSAIIVPGVFKNYPVAPTARTIDNLLYTTGAILDFDKGDVTPEDASTELEGNGLEFLTRTSFSHTEDHPRFATFVPWSEPCPPEKHAAAIEKYIKPGLNGHGTYALESLVSSQARFISPRAGAKPLIYLPEGEAWQYAPARIIPDELDAASAERQTYDAFAFIETDPEARQLFRLALNYIDADSDRRVWVSILGCGLRMFGITPTAMRGRQLSTDQWSLIADLEAFSSRGSQNKYREPENGRGINQCTAIRLNADGEWVPSMVMQYGAKTISGSHMITLTGVVKRTNFPEFQDYLAANFPELLTQARHRYGLPDTEEPVLPTEEEIAVAVAAGEVRVRETVAEQDSYRERINTAILRMPDGRAKRLANIIATLGDSNSGEWRMNPAASVILACQTINIVTAHRAFSKHGGLPPLAGNLYGMYFETSGAGKSAAVDYVKSILTRAGYGRATSSSKVFSISSMANLLLQVGPVMFYTGDEIKTWLSGGIGKKEANQVSLDSSYLGLWLASCHGKAFEPPTLAADRPRPNQEPPEPLRISQPNFSCFFVGVPSDINLLAEEMYSDGALARTLCFLPEERKNNRVDAWVDAQDRLYRNTDATLNNLETNEAAGMLLAYDLELERQGLGPALATANAGNGFMNEGEVRVPFSFRTFARARADMAEEDVRIITATIETDTAVSNIVRRMVHRYVKSADKLESFMMRLREITYRIALNLTLFDNPTATHFNHEHTIYAAELLELIEEPWFNRIAAHEDSVIFVGPYTGVVPAIKKLLDKTGKLYLTPGGVTVTEIMEQSEFRPLRTVLRGLKANSEGVRKDAQRTLDLLGIAVMGKPKTKGMFVFHPDHAPQSTAEDDGNE